ncbi:murein L,D-transpeptidase catalytic domain family protein [Fulvivirga sp. RKSG066]|uniref:murein L,D-transpeptidase catalytic domain family protein n=1 Tax=Fulvivirga aurantia TaxID=2529383 RepID=UPI0012BC37B3|nr:murein L,D-transpeptidase catalytic domain family protein [Fulvivirga aurantia]MTI21739.1 murein L,D-transpeptidase catalytic domain family protein [Fulvivirga aurantia]
MRKVFIVFAAILSATFQLSASDLKGEKELTLNHFIENSYQTLLFDGEKPDFEVYKKGLVGFLNLKSQNKLANDSLLTIIDFRLSSNKKRLWIIDLKENKVVYNSLVAHGRNTGNEFAKVFSNVPNSNSSSLGFYITAEKYYGKHGLSLRLDGSEPGFNDNARRRAVVMHGANYVDPSYTKAYGRIGRSFGCPSIPMKDHKRVINMIAEKSCLFIYYPDKDYLSKSQLINETLAYDILESNDFHF